MIWGGPRAKAVKKKLNGYSARKKKTQLNNSTAGWPGKKKLNANSLPEGPPQIINGPSLIFSFIEIQHITVISGPKL